jgi:hypothetical protein
VVLYFAHVDARHSLNLTIQRITGKDIRLLGNWEPVPFEATYSFEIAASLQVGERELQRCRDISDILNLMAGAECATSSDSGQESLF